MENVTLGVAIVASVLVLFLRPAVAFAVYISVWLFYPCYLTVGLGTLDITAARIVTVVLLTRCLMTPRLKGNFKWQTLDTWIVISMIVYVGMTCITHPLIEAVENRGGFLIDTCFAYFVARFCITDRASFITTTKWIGLALVPLALLGIVEACTGWQPFLPLSRFCPWYEQGILQGARWGLTRAIGPFSHPILFGGGFAMFLPLIYYLRNEKDNWHIFAYVLSGVALVGALSSLSSGPWVMVIAAIFCLAMEGYKHWVKLLLIFFASSCIFIGVASNRPFYHVIASYANPLGGAGWHRAKLIDLAIQHFGEWYLVGYGGKDPGWGESLGMATTDVTNEFILNGVKYGILGIVVLSGVLTTAFRGLLRTYKETEDLEVKSLCWSLGCVLFSVIVAWMSVSFFGQLGPLFYCILGIIGSSFNFARNTTGYMKQPFCISKFRTSMT